MNDLRHAFRQLVKSPGFSAVAVLTLAIGVAATASTFSVVKGLLLDPLPYPEPEQLVQVWTKEIDALFDFMPLSTPDFLDLEEQATSFAAIGTFSVRRFNLGGQRPEAIDGAWCTPGLFHALGVRPLHGRWFADADVAGEAAPVTILSHALWQQRFASDPDCIGQTIRIDGREHTIVGVMPREFELLSLWTRDRPLGLWTPLALPRNTSGRTNYWMASIARLKSGVSTAQADAELHTIASRIKESTPDANPRKTFWAMSLQRGLGGLPALRISVLLGAGWTLLVLAGQNVASMMLARGIGRHAEMAIRAALGAGRWRIIRLVLAETLLLSVTASGLGFLLTVWSMDALTGILPASVMPRAGLAIDGWLLGCIVVLALLIVQAAGLAPALLASKTDIVSGLKEGGASHSTARKTQRRLRRLVVGQIAMALLLVSMAIQLSDTYRNMIANTRPMVSDQVLTAALAVKGSDYDDASRATFWERLLEKAAALPGVGDVAVATKLPLDGGGVSMSVLVDDEAYNPTVSRPYTEVSYVSPGFFPAIGASLLQGRHLTRHDSGERWHFRAVVVNRALAEHFWPGENPLGRHIRPAQNDTPWSAEVVGVIDNLPQTPERPAKPEIYFSYADGPYTEAFLVVRAVAGYPVPLEGIRQELRGLDPDLALATPQTMQQRFDESGRVLAVITAIVNALSLAILGLAALGLYGTLSFTFARQQRDIGVRLALGASPPAIAGLVLRQAYAWTFIGMGLGLTGAWLLATGVGSMLSGASPFNLVHVAAGALIVLVAALAAAWIPARRATRISPLEALRAE